jgi:hypothetical protein
MVKVTMRPTVDFDDISAELGIHMSDCSITEMAENGSYITVDLSNERVEELKEEIEWEKGKSDLRLRKLENDLRIIELLRSLVPCDSILVFIFW